jgi:hypothetical protein
MNNQLEDLMIPNPFEKNNWPQFGPKDEDKPEDSETGYQWERQANRDDEMSRTEYILSGSLMNKQLTHNTDYNCNLLILRP